MTLASNTVTANYGDIRIKVEKRTLSAKKVGLIFNARVQLKLLFEALK